MASEQAKANGEQEVIYQSDVVRIRQDNESRYEKMYIQREQIVFEADLDASEEDAVHVFPIKADQIVVEANSSNPVDTEVQIWTAIRFKLVSASQNGDIASVLKALEEPQERSLIKVGRGNIGMYFYLQLNRTKMWLTARIEFQKAQNTQIYFYK